MKNKIKLEILGLVGVLTASLLPSIAKADQRHGHNRPSYSQTNRYYGHAYQRPVLVRRATHHIYPRPVYVQQPVVQTQVVYQPVYPAYQPVYQVAAPCPAPVQVINQPVYYEPSQPARGWGVHVNSNGNVGVNIHSRW